MPLCARPLLRMVLTKGQVSLLSFLYLPPPSSDYLPVPSLSLVTVLLCYSHNGSNIDLISQLCVCFSGAHGS